MTDSDVMENQLERNIRYPIECESSEPDCSPHPFDVMAIYALYQRVSK